MDLPIDFKELLEEFARSRVEAIVVGVVRVIGLDDLVANKRAAGRAQDLMDAELLERIRAASPDRTPQG